MSEDKCAGANGPVKTSGGLFSMFGDGGASALCTNCGSSSCTCNSSLTDHLKKCAGLGTLPPLIEKCDDIPGPGFRDRCPRSTCSDNSGSGSECFACGQAPPPPPPPPPEPVKVEPPPTPVVDSSSEGQGTAGGADGKKNKDCKLKCPPMPVSDCTDCKPSWMSCSPSLSKTYPAPDGVEVLPISIGGRNGRKSDSCGKCGEKKGSLGKPKVSSNCPMMRAKCPGLGNEEGGGFFAKLMSLFGGKAEKTPLEQVCEKFKIEDEQIRHHRDVFNTELVVRKDGYMIAETYAKLAKYPFLPKVDCAGRNSCEPDEPVVEEGCGCGCVEVGIQQPQVDSSCDEVVQVQEEGCCCCEEAVQVQQDDSGCEEAVQQEEFDCDEEVVEEELPCEEDATELPVDCCCGFENKSTIGTEQPSLTVGEGGDDDDDECIEDAEGECIRQEDDEESEPEDQTEISNLLASNKNQCNFDDPMNNIPDFNASSKCNFDPLNKIPACCEDCQQKGQNCCTPMSNFVIRIQAPFSDGSYESCESVLANLCKAKEPKYPEPQDFAKTQNCGLRVLEISLEPPTCIETPLSDCPCGTGEASKLSETTSSLEVKPVCPLPVEPPKPACPPPVEPPKPACPLPVEPPKPACPLPAEPPKPVCSLPVEPPKPACPLPVEPPKPACTLPVEPPKPACPLPVEPPKPACPLPAEPPKPVCSLPVEPPKPACPLPVAPPKPACTLPVEPPKPACPLPVEPSKPACALPVPVAKPKTTPCAAEPKPNSEKPPPPCPPQAMACPPKVEPSPTSLTVPPTENITQNCQCGALEDMKMPSNQELKDYMAQVSGRLSPSAKPCEEEPQPEPEVSEVCSCPSDDSDDPPAPLDDCSSPSLIEIESKPPEPEWNYEATPLTWDPSPPQQQCPIAEPEPDCTNVPIEIADEPKISVPETESISSSGCSLSIPEAVTADDCTPLPSDLKIEECETLTVELKTEECVESNPLLSPTPQDDCSTLSPEELGKKRLESVTGGCTCPNCAQDSGRQSTTGAIVWTPPVAPACPHCGATTRGDTENCLMCSITRRARDPYRYDVICPSAINFRRSCEPEEEEDICESDEFKMTPNGKPVYEGGMCLTRVKYFLWKTNPFENSLKKLGFENECFDGFHPARGDSNEEKLVDNCGCDNNGRAVYKGGMSLSEYSEFIWKATSSKK